MKDNARSKATYYSLARDKLMENHPKIFSFILILALISLTCLAAFLISDILSFGSDSGHKGALVGVDLQDKGKSILAILNGIDDKVNPISRDLQSEPNKVPNGSADANSSMKERGPENLSALKSSNSSRNGTFVSQSQVSGSSTAGGTSSSSSSNKQTSKRKVNSSNRKSESISSSAESSKSAKKSDDRLNQTQANNTQQIQTTINQSQKNQSTINDSQVIQLPSNYSQIIQIFSNFSKFIQLLSNYSHIIQNPFNEPQVIQLPSNESQVIQLPYNESKVNQLPFNEPQVIQLPSNESQVIQLPSNESQVIQLPSNESQVNQLPSNESQVNQLPSNESQVIQLPSNESQIIQLPSNESQINTSHSREPKIDVSLSSNISGDILTAEPENIEKRNAVDLLGQDNISISSDGILANSSASLAAEDKAQNDLADLDATGLDSGLKGAKGASELPEKRLVFKTDSPPELEPGNIQKQEEVSSGAASSSSAPLNLQVAESIEAEKIDTVIESPKSSTIEFSPEPRKKEGDSGRKSRITTSASRDQKKLQIAKAPQTSNRNKRSSNLNKRSTNSRAIPRSKKPSR